MYCLKPSLGMLCVFFFFLRGRFDDDMNTPFFHIYAQTCTKTLEVICCPIYDID